MKKRLLFILCSIFVAANLTVAQTKTVTNSDLEKHRQKRLEAERDYRENYSKLGFPSPEELEKQIEQSRAEREELSKRLEIENRQNQGDFQSRANVLRSEIASVEAQIAYLRIEANNLPESRIKFYSSGYFPLPNTTFPPFYQSGAGGYYQGATRIGINTSNVQIRTNPTIGNYNRGARRGNYGNGGMRIGISIGGGRRGIYRNRRGNYGNNYPYYLPVVPDNRSYERDEIVSRLRGLEQTRAGLLAEWSVLEDEARRAGVRID